MTPVSIRIVGSSDVALKLFAEARAANVACQRHPSLDHLTVVIEPSYPRCAVLVLDSVGYRDVADVYDYLRHASSWHGLVLWARQLTIASAVELIKCGVLDIITPADKDQDWLTRVQSACDLISERSKSNRSFEQDYARLSTLTAREREITNLIQDGLTTPQISLALSLSELTVDCHRANILKKLHLPRMHSLLVFLHKLGSEKSAASI